jgi:hypothetical protein
MVIFAMIPSTVPAAIMPVKLNARTRIITGIVTVAAYVDAEAFSASYRWCSDSDERG